MTAHRSAALVLFPGALGDLLCCWPGIDGLIAAGHAVTLACRADVADLLPSDDLQLDALERREISALFATTPAVDDAARRYLAAFDRIDSFTGAGDATFAAQLSAAARCPTAVHPFRGMRSGESAVAYYARCLGVPPRLRTLPIAPDASAWAAALWRAHGFVDRVLAMHPGSGGNAKNWHGMAALSDAWRRAGGKVVGLLGPVELERGMAIPADLIVAGASLSRAAAVLQRSDRYVGNDSGISHLAGLVGANAVVLFADSDSTIWAPSGAHVSIVRAAPSCDRCGPGVFCVHRLSVETVLRRCRESRAPAGGPRPTGAT